MYYTPVHFYYSFHSRLASLRNHGAFTLVELLAVVGIMATMLALVAPSLTGLKGSTDINTATGNVSGTLEQARAYAMAHNTFVYVGFQEVDANTSESTVPQVPGTGRVVIAVIASKDGTRNITTTNIVAISKIQRFENLHLGAPSATGNMARSPVAPPNQVHSTDFDLATASFQWPLTGTKKYEFKKVIEFDPQGVPRPVKGLSNSIVERLEVGLLQSKGSVVVNTPTIPAPQSAILVDGVSGATRIYRP